MLIGVAIVVLDGVPIIFQQERVGYCGARFRIWKFRTMIVDAEQKRSLLTVGKDLRITKTGYWLRKYKLDELPQLWNVVKGEMSLVGPRPEVPYYVNQYNDEQKRVLELIPGITDVASIKFRNESKYLSAVNDPEASYRDTVMPEKIRLNLQYAEQASLFQDLMVLFRTLTCIIH